MGHSDIQLWVALARLGGGDLCVESGEGLHMLVSGTRARMHGLKLEAKMDGKYTLGCEW